MRCGLDEEPPVKTSEALDLYDNTRDETLVGDTRLVAFERSFIESLQLNHQEDVLDVLKTGVIDDNVIKAIEETAAMVTKQFI